MMSETVAKEPEQEEIQIPGRKRWRCIGNRVWATIGVVATLLAIVVPTWQFWPRHALDIAFTNPSPDAVTSEGCVVTVSGHGSPPAGQALVLSNQQQGTGNSVDSTMYFAIATINGDTWQAVSWLGSGSTPAGTPFTLTAWLVNADWIKYLTQANAHPTWWGALGAPPGAVEIQSVNVTREAGKCS
jgi:hypothetical protein